MQPQPQFSLFLTCMAIGFACGILYEPFALFRLLFHCHTKNRWIGLTVDICYCLLITVGVTTATHFLKFPNFRVFWWLGIAVGGIIYLKSLHKIIAFFEKVCYNRLAKLVKKAKKPDKTRQKRKEKRI